MFFWKEKKEGRGGLSYSLPEFWKIFLPAIVFVLLYTALQYACFMIFRRLAAWGKGAFSAFVSQRPGLVMTFSIVVPMALSLLAVSGEGRKRLASFRKERSGPAADRRDDAGILVRIALLLCTCSFCILGNAQIQAMGLNSDSVYAMQPVYREIPFPLLLLIFAGFTPFAEEFVFRGLVYTGLRKRFPPLISVLVAAACFGLYHGEPIQGVYAFCMGLIFGLSMEETGDLRMSWILHGLANGLPLALSFAGAWENIAGSMGRDLSMACFLLSAGLVGGFCLSGRKRDGRGD